MIINIMRQAINSLRKEDGMGTVEIVLIIAVLVGLALIFRSVVIEFVTGILENILGVDIDPTQIEQQAPTGD